MSFLDDVKSVLPVKEELAMDERAKAVEEELKTKDAFIRKLKNTILLDAKKGKEINGKISGRMIFTQEIMDDDSREGYNWYGEKCPPNLNKTIQNKRIGLFKQVNLERYILVPSKKIVFIHNTLLEWGKVEKVFISDLYIYDKTHDKEVHSRELVLDTLGTSILGDSVQCCYDLNGNSYPFDQGYANYYYAVNYTVNV